jgi:choline-sulfatase
VLFIICDQLTASVLSCYGGPVHTPNIDRLASRGMRFERATCPTPVCSPSRGAMATGRYPHANGIVSNVGPEGGLTPDDTTMYGEFRDAGYNVPHYGKWHLGRELPCFTDWYTSFWKGLEDEMEKARQRPDNQWMNFYGKALPVDVSPRVLEQVKKLGDKWDNIRYADFIENMGRLEWPVEKHFDYRIASRAVERLRDASGDRPFMLTCSMISPHDPNVVPSPYYEMFDPDDIELPDNWKTRAERFEGNWSRRIVAELGEAGLREFLRIYYGQVKFIDDQVGRLLDALEDSGRADDTAVVFTSDHGDMAGGHGMVWKSTSAFYDEVARIPLIISYPGTIPAGETDIAAGMTDMMPTLLDIADLPIPDTVQGRSLLPYMTGEKPESEAPRYSFSERVPPNREEPREVEPGTPGNFMIRGRDWKYIRYHGGDEYLYHLAEDPGETRNLASKAEYEEKRNELLARMAAWLRRTGWPDAVSTL